MKMEDLWSYGHLTEPAPYGSTETYELGMSYLSGLPVVEDRGCGSCFARNFLEDSRYVGVDGTDSLWTNIKTDLRTYRSKPDGIFMRHVLEHNHDWEVILKNAIEDFTHCMVLVIFTPLGEETRQIATCGNGVPDISFKLGDLIKHFPPGNHQQKTLKTDTQYGEEIIFFINKKQRDSAVS
jgi:hypothetical protein